MDPLFLGLALIIIFGAILGYIAKKLRQPLIPAYVLAGLVLGPFGIYISQKTHILSISNFISTFTITNIDTISTLSEIGLAFMLFIVGLELDLKKLRSVTYITTIGGPLQILILFLIGILVAFGFGFKSLSIIYVGLFVAFSSTIIVIKLLSDKRELDTLHGRIVIGILLIEDFFAIMAITVLSSLDNFSFGSIVLSLIKAIIAIAAAIVIGKFIFPSLFKFAAKSQELLFILSLSVCFLFGVLFQTIGFSIMIGTFIAGLVLGNLEYRLEIISMIKPLKDFFSMIFFVALGLNLHLSSLGEIWKILLALCIVIILVKPLVTQLICSIFGYKKNVSFSAAIAMSQTSEFSLIIASQGLLLGHIDNKLFTLCALVSIITMTATSYASHFERPIYNFVKGLLSIFEKASPMTSGLEYAKGEHRHDAVLCGCHKIGFSILKSASHLKKRILVIDYNPEVIKELSNAGIRCMYGDAGDTEIIERMELDKSKALISTIPTFEQNVLLLKKAKRENPRIIVVLTSNNLEQAIELYEKGADYVIVPHLLSGERAAEIMIDFDNLHSLARRRVEHLTDLKRRKIGRISDLLRTF